MWRDIRACQNLSTSPEVFIFDNIHLGVDIGVGVEVGAAQPLGRVPATHSVSPLLEASHVSAGSKPLYLSFYYILILHIHDPIFFLFAKPSPCCPSSWFCPKLPLRVERPPGGLAGTLVLHLQKPLVQGQVVPDRVLRRVSVSGCKVFLISHLPAGRAG